MTPPPPTMYPGVHHPSIAAHVPRAMVSANVLVSRVSDFTVGDWILDSGAFTRIAAGKEHIELDRYAEMAERWHGCGRLLAVVTQDYMCEDFILEARGATVAEHQALTTERYCDLRSRIAGPYLMPVVQGYTPAEYAAHAADLVDAGVEDDAWVGIGSVCKRQGRPESLVAVLDAVAAVSPRWRLHGFGVKTTALRHYEVCDLLSTVDSMAWSFAARKQGRDANSADECRRWLARVDAIRPAASQGRLF